MKTICSILIGLITAIFPLVGKSETVTYKNVIYQPEIFKDYYHYWTVVGTTITQDSPDKNLYIIRGVVEGNVELNPDKKWAYKRFEREVFANNDLIENVYPYGNPKDFHPWSMGTGWFCSKAFYNTSHLNSFEFGCAAPPGYPSEAADSVFMYSAVRVIKIHNCTRVGISFAEGTVNLDTCYVENIGSMGENAFKDSGLKVLKVDYIREFGSLSEK